MNTVSRLDSAFIVIDVQDAFLAPVADKARIISRTKFLIENAKLLSVPILATEQYASRMGVTTAEVLDALGPECQRFDKLCFSCAKSDPFRSALSGLRKPQLVLGGIETHICVAQTALDLHEAGWQVFVCADAVGARSRLAHEIALARLASAGCIITHTESVCYEWLSTAESSEFKRALEIVKRYDESRD